MFVDKKNFHNKSMEKDTLILGGGGIWGYAMVGVLEVINQEFTNIVGTSVGGMIGYLLCIMTPQEIFKRTRNLNVFEDVDISNFFEEYGICRFDKMKDFLEEVTYEKIGERNITFNDLFKKTKKTLKITGTNITRRCSETFSRQNTPDMLIIDALRITTCVPFIFHKVKYRGDLYVDGSLLNPIPYNEFKVSKERKMCITAENEGCEKKDDIMKYIGDMIMTVIENQMSNNIKDIIKLKCDCYMLEECNESKAQKLYEYGKIEGKKYLSLKGFD